MTEFETFYYTDGNAVRQLENPMPDTLYPQERREKERREKEYLRRQRARINARQLKATRLQAVGLIFAITLLGSVFVAYVHLQNSITSRMNHIANLQEEVTALKADNSATQSRIATTTNLNSIKNKALNELGMVYASQDQIVYYNINDEDYMNQYNNIP